MSSCHCSFTASPCEHVLCECVNLALVFQGRDLSWTPALQSAHLEVASSPVCNHVVSCYYLVECLQVFAGLLNWLMCYSKNQFLSTTRQRSDTFSCHSSCCPPGEKYLDLSLLAASALSRTIQQTTLHANSKHIKMTQIFQFSKLALHVAVCCHIIFWLVDACWNRDSVRQHPATSS